MPRKAIVALVSIWFALTLSSCDGEANRLTTPEQHFAVMNEKLAEAVRLANALAPGETDENRRRLERMRQLIREVRDLKYRALDVFPQVWGQPFGLWYGRFHRIDEWLRVTRSLTNPDFIPSQTAQQRRDEMVAFLRQAKVDKETIERRLRPVLQDPTADQTAVTQALDRLRRINATIDGLIRDLERDPPNPFAPEFSRRLLELEAMKLEALAGFPPVLGTPFSVWYRNWDRFNVWLNSEYHRPAQELPEGPRFGPHRTVIIWDMERLKRLKEALESRTVE